MHFISKYHSYPRNREWRRGKLELYLLIRMKRWSGLYWYRFQDVNDILLQKPIWIDLINHKEINRLRDTRTTKWDSRHKIKWGKKGRKNYDWSSNINTRPKQKNLFIKELIEHGLK
jgi:hypothetical protein